MEVRVPSCTTSSLRRLVAAACAALGALAVGTTTGAQQQAQAPVGGTNVNIVSGTSFPDGDPFLQRQNEPSSAASTRNPLHLLAGANDYRSVDLPGTLDPLKGFEANADAWLGLFKSFDGGQTWRSTLVPGFPQDPSAIGKASPIKGRQAATDPVVRAGTNGLFYYAGVAFDRGEHKPSAIFVARFIDLNNRENGDPIAYLGTKQVAFSASSPELDKTALAVDIPRTSATCTLQAPQGDGTSVTQVVPAGNVYVAYAAFTGEGAGASSQIMFVRSTNCGETWSAPISIAPGTRLNQNAQIAIDPSSGAIYVSWRAFKSGTQGDGIFVAKSTNAGAAFGKPVRVAPIYPYDQGTSLTSFRSNGFQTMAIDATGRVYIAWSERGHATLRPDPITGDARIVVSTSVAGTTWSVPAAIRTDGLGHEVMPALSFQAGRLRMVYYDLREDVSQIFGQFVDEAPILGAPDPKPLRHTLDVYVAQATPAAAPKFTAVRLSDYATGYLPGSGTIQQMQFNPPNLPLFRQGTVPFMGDYLDLAPAPAFVQGTNGQWSFNTQPTGSSVAHAFWTDNRDVRPPVDGNWQNYTPVMSDSVQTRSIFDPNQIAPSCVAGHTGMRNQNVYTARVTQGLFVGSPGNAKTLGAIQRAFVVTVQNEGPAPHSYRLTIANQPPGGTASFLQFVAGAAPLTLIDVSVPAFSSVARSVFATSSNPAATIRVDVAEIVAPGAGTLLAGGLTGAVVLNGDASNPSIQNPSIQNPSIQNPDIQVAEVYNPNITSAFVANPSIQNPSIQNVVLNPSIQNPSIQNPSIQNPSLQNDAVANLSVVNPSIQNPSIQNPSIQNPSLQNPSIQNADVVSGAIEDTTWVVTNDGNTAASYAINLVMNGSVPAGFGRQLLIHKTYNTPAAEDCTLALQPHTILLANIPNPTFTTPQNAANPSIQNPSIQNPTISLAPGESADVTLRITDPNRFDGVTFEAAAAVTPAIVAHSVNTEDAAQGITQPSFALPLTITTAGLASATPGGAYQQTLQTFAGTGASTWTVTNGTLPPGLQLSSTGVISGTPTTPGNYVFTVQSTDANGHSDTQELSIQINPPTPPGFNRVWNGADTNWSNPKNWSPNGVPVATDNVYVAAGLPVMPSLTQNVTVHNITVEPGATVNTNGFTLTVTGDGFAGKTIVGAGLVALTGATAHVSGTFTNVLVAANANVTLVGSMTVLGDLQMAAGARLTLNRLPIVVNGSLITNAPAQPPVVTSGPTGALAVGGVNVNGLDLVNVTVTINGGDLARFDNVVFDMFGVSAAVDDLTINHSGTTATFTGVSFLAPATGHLVVAQDTQNNGVPLVVRFVNANQADGSAQTTTAGGASVTWNSTPGEANLAIAASTQGTLIAGAQLAYTLAVVNGGPSAAAGVVVTDTLPAGVTFVSATGPGGPCGVTASVVTCNVGAMAVGATIAVSIRVIPPAAGDIVNTATVQTTTTDPVPSNNSQTVRTTIFAPAAVADLSITKTDSADPVSPGAAFAYTITVHNAGPAIATNVVVRDEAPQGITFTSAIASAGNCTSASGVITCALGTLAVGQDTSITVTAVAGAAGVRTNYASVSATQPDQAPANNTAVQVTTVSSACAVPEFGSPTSITAFAGEVFQLTGADLDGNGTKDLLVSSQAGTGIRALINDGAGHYTLGSALSFGGSQLRGFAVGDFDGDNQVDIAVVGNLGSAGRLYAEPKNGGFQTVELGATTPFSVIAADFNEDGRQDLIVENSQSPNLVLFLNDGAGHFLTQTSIATGAPLARFVVADVNEDGHADIVAGHSGATSFVSVLLGDGHGGFATPVNYATGVTPILRGIADVNSDGHLDLIVVDKVTQLDQASRLATLAGDGHGAFTAEVVRRTATAIHTAQTADVNGDGRVDLVSTSFGDNTFVVQFGDGVGGFGAPLGYGAPIFSNVVVDDFNGDGRPDVAIGDEAGVVRVFPNACGATATDLSVTATDGPDPVAQGDIVAYTATVKNLTLTPAANVTVIANLPTTSLVQSTSDSGGTQSVNGRQVTWTLPTLGANATATFTYRVATSAAGTATFTVGVTANGADSDPSNNSAVETTTVQPMVGGTVCASPTLSGPTILPAGTTTGAADINAGDLNGDGRPDLVTSMANANAVAVYLANASGGYGAATLYPAGTQPIDAVLADFNGDNKLDLAIEGFSDAYLLFGNGTGGFGAPTTITFAPEIVSDVRTGDFNGDGKPDLAIATIRQGQPTAGQLRILLGDGAGSFTAGAPVALNASSGRLAIGDFNGDGKADVAASFTSNVAVADHVLVLLGDGNGGVASTIDVPTGQSATDASVAALGDLNGDGKLDLGVVENSGTARQLVLLFGDGTGHFTPQPLSNTAGIFRVASADMNGDGSLDLVATGTSFLGVLLGDGAGHFANPTFFSAPTALELRVADLNGDGRADVALAMQRAGAGGAAVMLNACGRASTDLGLTVNDSPDPVQEGGTLTYTMTVTNNGPVAASNASLTATLPASTTVTSVTPAAGTCAAPTAGVIACNLGELQSGSATSVTVQITPANGGALTLTAGVGADQADPNPANNSLTVSTTVTAIGRTILVTNTSDSGPGSLRQAILDSNADSGDVDRISFNIPGTGVHTIAPLTALPAMTQPAILDGTTQPGFTTSPIIELSGANIPTSGSGVGLEVSSGSTVKGLVVNRFRSAGMLKLGGGGATVSGNYIGTDPTGTIALPNAAGGIVLSDASGNSMSGNLISGNPTGIAIVGTDSGAFANVIVGNLIGTDPTGTLPVPNGIGIEIFTAQQNRIGGTTAAERNVISRNTQQGIVVEGTSAGNAILGNSITGNGSLGIDLENNGVTPNDAGDADAGANNRQNFPVLLSAVGNATTTTVAGSLNSAPNTTFRLELFSNAACDASGNGEGQSLIASTNVTTNAAGDATFTVDGAAASGFITATATDANGNTSEFSACVPVTTVTPFSVGNTSDSGPGSLRQAIIDGNADPGTTDHISFALPGSGVHTITLLTALPPITSPLVIDGTTQPGYTVGAPLIELNGNGLTGSGLRLSGGGATVRGLIINRFNGNGIELLSADNTVEGNYIGSDATGTLARPNTGAGISITGTAANNHIGGPTAGARNVIGGNGLDGIFVSGSGASGNTIQGNFIGSTANGGGTEPFETTVSLQASDILQAQNGTAALSTLQNHTPLGTRSLALAATGAGPHNIVVGDQVTEGPPTHGTITVYFYDAGPGLSAGAQVLNSVTGLSAGVGVQEGDAGCYKASVSLSATDVRGPNASVAGCTAGVATTSIQRSIGWHKLAMRADGQTYTLFIDDQTAFALAGSDGFDFVQVSVSGSSSGPTYFFDDFSSVGVGMALLPNGRGIEINGAPGTIIGGTSAGERNVISGNANEGILVRGAGSTGTVIQGNYLGGGVAGSGAFGNGIGIGISAPGVTIGGTAAGAGNVIVGTVIDGIAITGAGSDNTIIHGNIIGLNADLSEFLDNARNGILVGANVAGTQIGGTAPGAGNLIAFSGALDINVAGLNTTIQGNTISTDPTGTEFWAGALGGVTLGATAANTLIGGTTPGARNLITGVGNTGSALFINGHDNRVEGNYIGVNANGEAGAGNRGAGVAFAASATSNVVGGTTPGSGNVISGNFANGVSVNGTSNLIAGNRIGTNASGTTALPNGFGGSFSGGVTVQSGSTGTRIGGAGGLGNQISGNNSYGINVDGTDAVVMGNVVGLNAAGTGALGNAQGITIGPNARNAHIGGTNPSEGNVISGNNGFGINLANNGVGGHLIQRNDIGTNVARTGTVGNTSVGIFVATPNNTIGGSDSGAGNVISGNQVHGIQLAGATATGNIIQGNWIGTDRANTLSLANAFIGIDIINGAVNNVVGGAGAARNTITHNPTAGVQIRTGSTGNVLRNNAITANGSGVNINDGAVNNTIGGTGAGDGNFIHDNGKNLLITGTTSIGNAILGNSISGNFIGIDLGNDVVSPNDPGDADTGPNNLQNFPVLTSATVAGSTLTVLGTLNSTANTAFRLEFFSNAACDPTGNGDGDTFLGSLPVTTDGAGNVSFTASLPAVSAGQAITSTATDPANNTSEFSTCRTVPGQPQTFTVTNTNDSGPGSFRQAILDANAGVTSLDTIRFNIPGTGLHTIAALSGMPNVTDPVIIDGTTQPGYAGVPLIELNGTSAGSNIALAITAGGSTVRGLAIDSWAGNAISISGGNGNVVEGNYIGTDPTGTLARGNLVGVSVQSANNRIGGTTAAARNVISGNQGGVFIRDTTATGNVVQGNYIGTNAAGTAAVPNTGVQSGVQINNGASSNTIGGGAPGAGNVVSGNAQHAITICCSLPTAANIVQGNLVGVAANGTTPLSNAGIGIDVVTALNTSVLGNVVSNNGTGVQIRTGATGNVLRNNLITSNGGQGLRVDDTSGNTIGGTAAGDGNVIQNNGTGVVVLAATSARNAILGNSISGNGGLGIDLNGDGVTANDAGDPDTGANNLQNFPLLSAATVSGTVTTILGTLNSSANTTFRLEFFSNAACDGSGNGEGQTLLGSMSATTDGTGNASFTASVPLTTIGSAVTATATDPNNNTSEFSACRVVAAGPVVQSVTNTNDSGAGSLRQALLNANADLASTDTISFNIPGAGPHTITLASSLPDITGPVVIDGTTEPDFAGTPVVEISGNNVAVDGLTLKGGNSTVRGLVINRFQGTGIVLIGAGNVIEGNYIGIDPGGTLARSNTLGGILLNSANNRIGGTTTAARNVVSGSAVASGITVVGAVTGNTIQGNYIGLNAAGTAAIPNQFDGIRLTDATNTQIGGTAAGAGNVISGNVLSGIRFIQTSTGNHVEGNRIGLNAAGSAKVANGEDGVTIVDGSTNVIGGTAAAARNFISGNTGNGVWISQTATANTIQNNTIGQQFPGGNGANGVLITNGATGNTIDGNQIWFNGQDGITIASGTGNRLVGNSITANSQLGIDLNNDGPTPNDVADVDAGANNLQNFPIITSAPMNSPSSAFVTATLNSSPNTTFRVNFYGDTPCGAGLVLGATDVTTNASGNATFSATVFNSGIPSLSSATFVTATATDPNGNTSELSPCLKVSDLTDLAVTLADTPDPVQVGGVVTYQATVVNNGPSAGINVVAAFAFTAGATVAETGGCPGTVTTSPGVVTCPIGTMAVGATVLPFIRLTPTTSNPITVVVSITSDQGESQTANNVATATTTVGNVPTTFTVTNTNDGGPGSFRQAILDANASSGTTDTIWFSIPGSGPRSITLLTALPAITDPVTIDATIQLGFAGTPIVELNGNGLPAIGLDISAGGTTIRGFIVNRFGEEGILVRNGTGSVIENNWIGTDVTGTLARPNGRGVRVLTSSNRIGGTTPGAANLIAFNTGAGIAIETGGANSIYENSIFSNGGLGIDLASNGITPNDAGDVDPGANLLQNFPVLTSAVAGGGTTLVQGTLNSTATTTFRLEFFSNPACDASGNGEGRAFIGAASVTTNASGNAVINVSLPAVAAGQAITSTATPVSNNTSEFSACQVVTAGTPIGDGSAVPLPLSGFSGSERVETFNPNFGRQNSPVTFNGVTYSQLPSGGLWSDINYGQSGYFSNFPDASGFTVLNDIVSPSNLQIDFPTPVNRVGLFAAPGPTTYTMTAYDDALNPMGSVTQTTTVFKAVYLGLQGTRNIRRVIITETGDPYPQIGIFDDVRYENWTNPEILRQHVGTANPTTEGFTSDGVATGSAINNDVGSGLGAWRIQSPSQTSGFYSSTLSAVDKQSAMTRGWKITARLRVDTGDTFVDLDFLGFGNRFDIHLHRDTNGDTVVQLGTTILPLTGPSFTLTGSGSSYHLYELVFDPITHTASLAVDGGTRLTGYAGTTEFQSQGGLMIGSGFFNAANGVGYHNYVRLELR